MVVKFFEQYGLKRIFEMDAVNLDDAYIKATKLFNKSLGMIMDEKFYKYLILENQNK